MPRITPNYSPEFDRDEHGPFVRVSLRAGVTMLIDEADWFWVSQTYWIAHKNDKTDCWYVERSRTPNDPPGPSKIKLHRLILGLADNDPMVADHRDGNGLNNRRYNLRPATSRQNTWNTRRSLPKSGYRGVHFTKDGSWKAQVNFEGKKVYLGRYDTKEKAAAAYQKFIIEHRGEFAVNNLPPSPDTASAGGEG